MQNDASQTIQVLLLKCGENEPQTTLPEAKGKIHTPPTFCDPPPSS